MMIRPASRARLTDVTVIIYHAMPNACLQNYSMMFTPFHLLLPAMPHLELPLDMPNRNDR
jgi:hypothetical protein